VLAQNVIEQNLVLIFFIQRPCSPNIGLDLRRRLASDVLLLAELVERLSLLESDEAETDESSRSICTPSYSSCCGPKLENMASSVLRRGSAMDGAGEKSEETPEAGRCSCPGCKKVELVGLTGSSNDGEGTTSGAEKTEEADALGISMTFGKGPEPLCAALLLRHQFRAKRPSSTSTNTPAAITEIMKTNDMDEPVTLTTKRSEAIHQRSIKI
jgi:hypothetical protein